VKRHTQVIESLWLSKGQATGSVHKWSRICGDVRLYFILSKAAT